MSDNIRVRSILGRYLEHSRIYRFGHGNVADGERMPGSEADALHLIGSADLMPRNLRRRVEVLVPVKNPRHTVWLDQVLQFSLADDVVAWELRPDDTWARIGPRDTFQPHPQERMYRWAAEQQLAGRQTA
jgi:polyphosphate kinase